MFAPSYLSMPQLLQWSNDPWSFWYPRTIDLTQFLRTQSGAAPISVGMPRGGLFVPGTGPTWELRGRAAFPPAIVVPTIALAASAFVTARARAAQSVSTTLSGQTSVQVRSTASAAGKVALAGAAKVSVFARVTKPGAIALFATSLVKVSARAAMAATLSMTASTSVSVRSYGSAAARAALGASTAIRAAARSSITAALPMVALSALTSIKVTAKALMNVFRPSPRVARTKQQIRTAIAPQKGEEI
jgi:hypothetical protein